LTIEKGKGSGLRFVTFETASRDGKPFEDAISKYGIFNPDILTALAG